MVSENQDNHPRRRSKLIMRKVSNKRNTTPKIGLKDNSVKSSTKKNRSKPCKTSDKLPNKEKPSESFDGSCLTKQELHELFEKFQRDGHFRCEVASAPLIISRVEDGKLVTTKIEYYKTDPELVLDLASKFTVRRTERPVAVSTIDQEIAPENSLPTTRAILENFIASENKRLKPNDNRDCVPLANSTVLPSTSCGNFGQANGYSEISVGSNIHPQFSSVEGKAPRQNGFGMSFADSTRPNTFNSWISPDQPAVASMYVDDTSRDDYSSNLNEAEFEGIVPPHEPNSVPACPFDSMLWTDTAAGQTSSNACGANTSKIHYPPQPSYNYSMRDSNGYRFPYTSWNDSQMSQNSFVNAMGRPYCGNPYTAAATQTEHAIVNSWSQNNRIREPFGNIFETAANGVGVSSPMTMNNFANTAATVNSVAIPRTINAPIHSQFGNASQSSNQSASDLGYSRDSFNNNGPSSMIPSSCSRDDNINYHGYTNDGNVTYNKENIGPTSSILSSTLPSPINIKEEMSSWYGNDYRRNSGTVDTPTIYNLQGQLFDPECYIIKTMSTS